VTSTQIITGSGEASIKVHSTTDSDFAIAQVLKDAHKLGVHHLITSKDGTRAVSAGFGGDAKVWKYEEGMWKPECEIDLKNGAKKAKAGEVWALALSLDGQYLAATTYDGRVNVWDLANVNEKFREYETKGSFGMCVDLVSSPSPPSNESLPGFPMLSAAYSHQMVAS